MKYLSITMSSKEAKAAYRKLSMTLHPDMGGDEEEFKILASEYAAIVKAELVENAPTYEDLVAEADRKVAVVVDTLSELYPRTPIHLGYTHDSVMVEILNNTPLKKMLHIEEITKTLTGFRVTLLFRRGGSKKQYSLWSVDKYTYINIERGDKISLIDRREIYSGTRYVISRNKRYEVCQDKKSGHNIVLRRTPKFNLKELLDL